MVQAASFSVAGELLRFLIFIDSTELCSSIFADSTELCFSFSLTILSYVPRFLLRVLSYVSLLWGSIEQSSSIMMDNFGLMFLDCEGQY